MPGGRVSGLKVAPGATTLTSWPGRNSTTQRSAGAITGSSSAGATSNSWRFRSRSVDMSPGYAAPATRGPPRPPSRGPYRQTPIRQTGPVAGADDDGSGLGDPGGESLGLPDGLPEGEPAGV